MLETKINITQLEDNHTSGAYFKRPLTVVRGEGCTVWDDEGNAYYDMTSGQGVAALGHSHQAVVEAIVAQAQNLITLPEIFYNDQRARFYELLSSVTPGDLNRFFLCNSGAEAIEGALKVAHLLTGRNGVVATKRGFHGRTLGALALTWDKKYREPFSDWQLAAEHITYDDLDAAQTAITSETAAVVVEVVQGEGGVHPATIPYLQGLRDICDRRGALLIVDEIQTGFGRTGRWFAFEHADILPDIVAMGKAVGGGVPMGVVAWRDSHGQIPAGSHGSTFGGNPLACAAAIATITTLRDTNILPHVTETGDWLLQELRNRELSGVREIRGLGFMIGVELRNRVTPVLKDLQSAGVLALPAGSNVLRLLPPLICQRQDLEIVVQTIQDVLDAQFA
jgi:acetylornithine/LysW-gamma-L-lysine aminotransferase